MSNYLVPALTRAVAITENRCLNGVFRKAVCQNQLGACQTENVSSQSKRCLVISKFGGHYKKSDLLTNFSKVLQRSKDVFNLLYYNSCKSFLSSSVQTSKAEKKEEKASVKKNEISFDDLKAFMKVEEKFLFDVREPCEVAQTGMLPSAINLPLSKLKSSLAMSEEEFKSEFKVEKPTTTVSNMVVFYGLASVKGASAVEIAHKMGYTKYYPGGYEEWKKKQQEATA